MKKDKKIIKAYSAYPWHSSKHTHPIVQAEKKQIKKREKHYFSGQLKNNSETHS